LSSRPRLSPPRHPLPRRALAIAAAVGLALSLTLARPAHAGNDLGVRVPDGTPVYLFRNALTAGFSDAVAYVRTNGINPTDMTSLYASGVSSTYINIVDNDYGPSQWVGMYDCATGPNRGVCSRGDVIINLYQPYVPGGSWSATERRSLVCEEIGHALGLAHRTTANGCMSQDWNDTDYSAHDDAHLNNWY
jgi:hypothetical protein